VEIAKYYLIQGMSVLIEIKGWGYELQWHSVDKAMLKSILETFKSTKVKGVLSNYFTGGILFDKKNFSAYGCDINALIEIDGIPIDANFQAVTEINESSPNLHGADLYYFTRGEVNGSGTIESNKPFDLKKLSISYASFTLGMGGVEGSIITEINYDGSPVSINFEDDGLENRHWMCMNWPDDEGNVGTSTTLFFNDEKNKYVFIADDLVGL
jgi:hypothetical protein